MTTATLPPREAEAFSDAGCMQVVAPREQAPSGWSEASSSVADAPAPSQFSGQHIGHLGAGTDLGACEWERALIATIRGKGFISRTERMYRDWAERFVRFLAPRPVDAADENDVGAFLTSLAVRPRSSRSTQKQALNAVVFLLREALKRPLNEITFQRATPCQKLPILLTHEEIERVHRHLDSTTRLMAELAFGVGLRPLELLRLRIHHVDLRRLQLQVSADEGEKGRVAVMPPRLAAQLETHLGRLRQLHALDRAAGLPGVWLPEEVAAKDRQAGGSLEWQWLFPSRELAVDPRTGRKRRHHVTEGTFECAVREAGARARITKPVTPHVLWYSQAREREVGRAA